MRKRAVMIILSVFLLLPVFKISAKANDFNLLMEKAWNLRTKKDFTKAEKNYLNALRINPESEDAWTGLIYTRTEKGDFTGSRFLANHLTKCYPKNLWIRKAAAWTYFNLREYEKAAENYGYIAEKSGGDEILLGLGLSLLKLGRKNQAEKVCLKISDKFKNNPSYLKCIGKKENNSAITPDLYLTFTDYSGEAEKENSFSLSTGLNINPGKGPGLYLFANGINYKYSKADESDSQFTYGAAAYYSLINHENSGFIRKGLLWISAAEIYSNKNHDVEGRAFLLNLSGEFSFLKPEIEYAKGFYNGFETEQISSSMGFSINRNMEFYLKPVLLKTSGEKELSLTKMEDRFSMETGLNLYLGNLWLKASFYRGNRWFFIDNMGTSIWNADEELDYGGNLSIRKTGNKRFSPYLSIGINHADKAYGIEKDYLIRSITAGFSFKL